MLKAIPRGLPEVRVFTRSGKPIKCVREGFEAACRKAAIEGFTFHDLRHTYITNKDREGHSHIVIMASTGHKTMNVFRRYRAVSREDLRTLVEAGNENGGQYLDSEPQKEAEEV
jgi:integrase